MLKLGFLYRYFWIIITLIVFGLDRITKFLVLDNFILEDPVNILPFLNIFFTLNSGAAFSFLNNAGGWQEWLFISVAVVVSVFLVVWQTKIVVTKDRWLKIALALVLGGTLGNLYDRVLYHQVIDFIDFYFRSWHYPIFNIADAAISIGAVMLIIDIFRKGKRDR